MGLDAAWIDEPPKYYLGGSAVVAAVHQRCSEERSDPDELCDDDSGEHRALEASAKGKCIGREQQHPGDGLSQIS